MIVIHTGLLGSVETSPELSNNNVASVISEQAKRASSVMFVFNEISDTYVYIYICIYICGGTSSYMRMLGGT